MRSQFLAAAVVALGFIGLYAIRSLPHIEGLICKVAASSEKVRLGEAAKILTTVNFQLQPLSYKLHLAFGYCATETYAPRRAT